MQGKVISIKSCGSRFHDWLPLNLTVWYPRWDWCWENWIFWFRVL